jgi:hypothetical protein
MLRRMLLKDPKRTKRLKIMDHNILMKKMMKRMNNRNPQLSMEV